MTNNPHQVAYQAAMDVTDNPSDPADTLFRRVDAAIDAFIKASSTEDGGDRKERETELTRTILRAMREAQSHGLGEVGQATEAARAMLKHPFVSTTAALRSRVGELEKREQTLLNTVTVHRGAINNYKNDLEQMRIALEGLIHGLPELLESIGYVDEEGLIAKARAALDTAK